MMQLDFQQSITYMSIRYKRPIHYLKILDEGWDRSPLEIEGTSLSQLLVMLDLNMYFNYIGTSEYDI